MEKSTTQTGRGENRVRFVQHNRDRGDDEFRERGARRAAQSASLRADQRRYIDNVDVILEREMSCSL